MFGWLRDREISQLKANMKVLEATAQALETRMDALQTNMNSLRGLINRKVREKGRINEPDEEVPELTPQEVEWLNALSPEEKARVFPAGAPSEK